MNNLFDTHPPFQIDGNFGYASGVCEMLVQSHMGVIHLLPALPAAWPQGRVKGMRARGRYALDVEWKDGNLSRAVIRSEHGGTCSVRIAEASGAGFPPQHVLSGAIIAARWPSPR